jgi:hypothetical protein
LTPAVVCANLLATTTVIGYILGCHVAKTAAASVYLG